MPSLGLAIGLDFQNSGLTPYQKLLKSADWFIDFSRPQGTIETDVASMNTRQINPTQDLAGKVGKNLFDYLSVSKGMYVNNTGALSALAGYNSSAFIQLKPNTTYYLTKVESPNTALYDSNKTFTRILIGLNFSFTTDTSETFVRFSVTDANLLLSQLELGTVATAYEPYGKANVLMQNVARTTSDGFATAVAPNGKTVVGFQADGVNTYGVLPSNAPNPTSGDFAFARTIKTVATIPTQYFMTRAESSEATCQYGFKLTNTGILSLILEGTLIQIATGILANTWYDIVVTRISGTLKVLLSGVEVVNQAHAVTLTSRPNVRKFALSTDVGGTTHTGYSNVLTLKSGYQDSDIPKFVANWRKLINVEYGI